MERKIRAEITAIEYRKTTEKLVEPKVVSENLNFIDMYFKQNGWKKKDKTSIKNESSIITTASVDANRIIRKYEQLYADKSDNMDEMDKVLKRLK